jgi:hypothetical protein
MKTMLGIISSLNPNARIFDVRVMESNGFGLVDSVIAGLDSVLGKYMCHETVYYCTAI